MATNTYTYTFTITASGATTTSILPLTLMTTPVSSNVSTFYYGTWVAPTAPILPSSVPPPVPVAPHEANNVTRYPRAQWRAARDLTEEDVEQLCQDGVLRIKSRLMRTWTYEIRPLAYSQLRVWARIRGHDRYLGRICVQPTDSRLTIPEWVAVEKMLLLADEERFLRTANHFPENTYEAYYNRRVRRYTQGEYGSRYSENDSEMAEVRARGSYLY